MATGSSRASAIYGGKIFRLRDHLERLYDSAKAIWLTVPMSIEAMAAATEETVQRSGIAEGYIRHIVTRGVGDLGLDPRKSPDPQVIIIVDTIKLWPEELYENGLTVVTAGTPIPQRESLSPRVKSLNYLDNILAKIEGVQAGADEVLMLDSAGSVAEGSGAEHLRGQARRRQHAARSYAGILKGVTRDVVIELAARGRARGAGDHAQPVRRLHRRRGVLYRHGRRGHRDPPGGRPDHRPGRLGPRDPRHPEPVPEARPKLSTGPHNRPYGMRLAPPHVLESP